jgi:hypothetical protein
MEEAVRGKLGNNPQTNIVLEINRQPGSEQLAIEMACALAGKYPVTVHNLRAQAGVFSGDELLEMRDRGKELF